MKLMERVRGGARGLGDPHRSYRCSPGRRYRGLGLLAVLVATAALASAACRGPQASDGVGGQSGDEGRRSNAPWQGTGGVAAVPARP